MGRKALVAALFCPLGRVLTIPTAFFSEESHARMNPAVRLMSCAVRSAARACTRTATATLVAHRAMVRGTFLTSFFRHIGRFDEVVCLAGGSLIGCVYS